MTTTNDAEEAKGNANLDVSSQGGSNTDIGGFRHAIHDRFMAGFKKQMLESCGVSMESNYIVVLHRRFSLFLQIRAQ